MAEIRVPGLVDTSVNFQNLALDGTSLRESVTLLANSLEVIRLGDIGAASGNFSFGGQDLDSNELPLTQEEILEVEPD